MIVPPCTAWLSTAVGGKYSPTFVRSSPSSTFTRTRSPTTISSLFCLCIVYRRSATSHQRLAIEKLYRFRGLRQRQAAGEEKRGIAQNEDTDGPEAVSGVTGHGAGQKGRRPPADQSR